VGLLGRSRARPGATPAEHATRTVAIDGTRFQPEDIAVEAGDSIVWVNRDPFPHTVTSRAAGFDSQEIAPGKSWTYKASAKGEITYICTLHPTMKGALKVK
jgi:plastocyanin